MENELTDLFLNPKPSRILCTIHRTREDTYSSKIAKKVDTTYSHTIKTVQKLEEQGLIEKETKGRKNILQLTDRGEEIADQLNQILQKMKNQQKTGIIDTSP